MPLNQLRMYTKIEISVFSRFEEKQQKLKFFGYRKHNEGNASVRIIWSEMYLVFLTVLKLLMLLQLRAVIISLEPLEYDWL